MTSKPLSRRADSWLLRVWPSGFRDKTVFSYAIARLDVQLGLGVVVYRGRLLDATILACTSRLLRRFPAVQFAATQSTKSRREIDFQALGARASESRVVRKNDVATVLTDQSLIGKGRHRGEFAGNDAIGATIFFFLFHGRRSTLGLVRLFLPNRRRRLRNSIGAHRGYCRNAAELP